MDGGPLHERLRRARTACGEELSALSRRTGTRIHHLRAIEDGRFADLPPGLYARAAVRAFAEAYGFDAAAVLAECDDQLPKENDPIQALARKSGISPARVEPATPAALAHSPAPWRLGSAAAIDAVFVGALLMAVIVLTALVGRVPPHALGPSVLPLAIFGLILAGGYFVWFGGLCRTTLGRAVLRAEPRPGDGGPATLRTMAAGALLAATEDARVLVGLGATLARGRATPGAPSRSAPRLAPALSRLRRLDLSPARWSSSSRAAGVPPPPLRPRRG